MMSTHVGMKRAAAEARGSGYEGAVRRQDATGLAKRGTCCSSFFLSHPHPRTVRRLSRTAAGAVICEAPCQQQRETLVTVADANDTAKLRPRASLVQQEEKLSTQPAGLELSALETVSVLDTLHSNLDCRRRRRRRRHHHCRRLMIRLPASVVQHGRSRAMACQGRTSPPPPRSRRPCFSRIMFVGRDDADC